MQFAEHRTKIIIFSILFLLLVVFSGLIIANYFGYFSFKDIKGMVYSTPPKRISLSAEISNPVSQISNSEAKLNELTQNSYKKDGYEYENGVIRSHDNGTMRVFLPNTSETIEIDTTNQSITFQKPNSEGLVELVQPDPFLFYKDRIVSVKKKLPSKKVISVTLHTI